MARRRISGARTRTPEPEGRPAVVSLEVDYGYPSLLVDRSPGVPPVQHLDPGELGLSPRLVTRLGQWLERWERVASWGVSHHLDEPEPDGTADEWAALERERLTLAHAVQTELGSDVEVLLDGVRVRDHRGC